MSRLPIALATLLAAGCTAADTDNLEVALTGQGASGATYRLRSAQLVVTGGELERVLDTEVEPDLPTLSTRLPPGAYTLAVTDGWYLERRAPGGSFTTVDAALTSPNPAGFTIVEDAATRVTLRFRAGGDDVPLGDGRLDVDIAVDEVDAAPAIGLGPWTGNDVVAPSQSPPFGLAPAQVPQLVVLGFEDNGYSGLAGSGGTGGMAWLLDVLRARHNADGSPVRATFFHVPYYIANWVSESPTYVKRAWRAGLDDGHEIGNHTQSHATGSSTTRTTWSTEITTAGEWLSKPYRADEPPTSPDNTAGIGASVDQIVGFRAPFLDYNDAAFAEVNARSPFRYDNSIEEGWQDDQDGMNLVWPYTLDTGSPGHDAQPHRPAIGSHPGLWEIPVYVVIAPPDDRCAEYGLAPGFRARLRERQSWFDVASGKLSGMDYVLWHTFQMSKAEFLATLRYTLDQRLAGNRAPFVLSMHSDYYSSKWTATGVAPLADRQAALAELIDYATSQPEVRVTSAVAALDWIRNPTPL
jgi:peptidoglycan/xylan/chitin deacetylase (PgdA/CDA1 family)